MNSRTAKLKWTLLVGLFGLLAAGRAQAQCMTDLDCPNAACGGDVCVRSSGTFSCAAAGERGTPGADGWCADANGVADNSKCKCRGLGAICDGFYCTFTMAPDGSVTGAGGTTGTAGTGGSGAGGSGTAGTGAGTGGGDGGGCSVAGAPSLGGAAGVSLLLAALMRRRARRR